MANQHGDYIWYELTTTDADAAQAFYAGLVGWTFVAPDLAGMDYRMFGMGAPEVGGLMALTPEMREGGARPVWTAYIAVDDVDAAAEKVAATGGTVMVGPDDIPDVGRFAFCADPTGATFNIMRGFSDEDSHAFALESPREGHCAWNELVSADRIAAERFYESLFGWEQAETLDLGEIGPYDMYRNPPHTAVHAAIMQKSAEMPASMWNHYFRVPDIDVAARYTADHGGQILFGPEEIPGGEFVFNAIDPQGAVFSLLGKRNEGAQ